MPRVEPSPFSSSGAEHIPDTTADDWYAEDAHLQWLVRRHVGEAVWPTAHAAMAEAGRLVPERIDPLMPVIEANPPVLRQFDRRGQRVDEVDYHPGFREVESIEHGFGLVGMGQVPGWRGLAGVASAPLHSGVEYLFLQADQPIAACPVGMASAMCRALRLNDQRLADEWVPKLASMGPDYHTAAMFMTEKAGGSDVGANECTAARDADGHWRIWGEKWFCSNPTADLVLILARPEGAGAGTRGLGLFLMPRMLPDGVAGNPLNANPRRNAYILHRLKPKFGNRALASAEIGLRGAFAWQVGDLDRGMKQMLDMVNATRVGIVTAAAGSMRRAVFESLRHTSQRQTFGRRLDHHPLMRDTLVELVTDSVATLSAGLETGAILDRADRGDAEAARLLRVLTPVLKGYAAERARVVATEAMEVRGGNGYIEDWPNGRLLRDVYVHAIWEGSGNIMALDTLRALAHGAGPAYFDEVERLTEGAMADGAPAADVARALHAGLGGLRADVADLARLDPEGAQLRMRRLERRMAITYLGALLAHQAQEHAASTGSGRLGYLAARFAARLAGPAGEAAVGDDESWLADFDGIAVGGVPVSLETARRAGAAVARALGTAAPV
jgi:alkylation response protein AidB-like acyl-CoA dehydrogenase